MKLLLPKTTTLSRTTPTLKLLLTLVCFGATTENVDANTSLYLCYDEILDQVGEMYHGYRHDLKFINYKTYDEMAFGFGLFSVGPTSQYFFCGKVYFFLMN